MVRTVKTKAARSLSKGQRALLLPGPTEAEPWEVWALGGKAPAQFVQICATPLANRLRKNTTLALPVSQVFCLPLWLNETDAKQFAGIIPLQLELRGLQPRGTEPAVFDWTVVAQEGTRTLVMVGVLPATLPPEIHVEGYDAFDLSARYLPFPENTLTIWREHDRLAVAITRGKSLVYYQALAEGQITPRVVQDLICAQATLTMQGILAPLRKVLLWTKISPEELAALQEALPLPIEQQEECPPLVAPSQNWKLTPAIVGAARRARETQRWQRRALAIFLLVYVLTVAWMASRYITTSLKVDELRKWQSDNNQALVVVRDGRAAWKELAPVVDTKNYPLELLLHVSQSIPADLHLTLFEASEGHLLIKGEAKNVAGAFTFLSKLKSDPYLSGYTLDMGNPRPLPNDLAQFQIEGTRATTN